MPEKSVDKIVSGIMEFSIDDEVVYSRKIMRDEEVLRIEYVPAVVTALKTWVKIRPLWPKRSKQMWVHRKSLRPRCAGEMPYLIDSLKRQRREARKERLAELADINERKIAPTQILKQKKVVWRDKWLVCPYDLEHWVKPLEGSLLEDTYLSILPVGYWDPHGWKAMDVLEITGGPRMMHECPITDMKYYGCVPFAIITTNSALYSNRFTETEKWRGEWMLDKRNQQEYRRRILERELCDIGIALMGTGYQDGIRPLDGGGSIVSAMLDLDNGDTLVAWIWEWSNK